MLLLAGLATAGLFAATTSPVVVTLPHAVTVGNTVLPEGQYTISSLDLADGDTYFVVRSAHLGVATLQAQRVITGDEKSGTAVVFSKDGETWHFDKMTIEGQDASYQFLNLAK